jgi:hypothetical protein
VVVMDYGTSNSGAWSVLEPQVRIAVIVGHTGLATYGTVSHASPYISEHSVSVTVTTGYRC